MPNGTFSVQIITKGKNPTQWMKEVNDKIHFEFQERLVELGEETAIRMGEIITDNTKRYSSGKLANNIKSEILSSTGGVRIGIGNINTLKQNAPYFEILNSGGYVPPANLGFFMGDPTFPTQSGAGQTWIHTGDSGKGNYLMRPHKAIEGISYIEIASEELRKKIEREIQILMGEWTSKGRG